MIILLLVILLLIASSMSAHAEAYKQQSEMIEPEKWCPPHKWEYVDVKNQDGEVVKWKLVCKLCGPLKKLDGDQ